MALIDKAVGDTLHLTQLRLTYTGSGEVYICWGLRAGSGNYENGRNLALGKYAYDKVTLPAQTALMERNFTFDAPLKLVTGLVPGTTYGAYIWVTCGEPSYLEKDMISSLLDMDADVAYIFKPEEIPPERLPVLPEERVGDWLSKNWKLVAIGGGAVVAALALAKKKK